MKRGGAGESWPTEMELVDALSAEDLPYSSAARLFAGEQRAASVIAAFMEHGLVQCVDRESGRNVESWELQKPETDARNCTVRLTDQALKAWETGPWSIFEPVLKRLKAI